MDEDTAVHKKLGIELFNYTWELLDKPQRTREEDDTMIHAAHASRFHWEKAGGTAVNLARGEWQVSGCMLSWDGRKRLASTVSAAWSFARKTGSVILTWPLLTRLWRGLHRWQETRLRRRNTWQWLRRPSSISPIKATGQWWCMIWRQYE